MEQKASAPPIKPARVYDEAEKARFSCDPVILFRLPSGAGFVFETEDLQSYLTRSDFVHEAFRRLDPFTGRPC